MSEQPKRILLIDETYPGSHRRVWAEAKEDGCLVFDGVDTGEAVKAMHGDSDYEFQIALAPESKDALLLALLQQNFKSVDQIKIWLETKGIAFDWKSY